MTDPRCEEVQALIPEVAMGVAPGPERASALAHIAGCAACRAELDRTAQTVDELLLLAPAVEPPSGFEARVHESFVNAQRRTPRPLIAAIAAAGLVAAALTGVGLARWQGSDDRVVADAYQQTLDVADGKSFHAADLTMTSGPAVGSAAGHVFAYDGQPSWVFMTVDGVPSERYRVQLVSEDGEVWDIGWCRVRDGYESWGTTVDVPVTTIDRLEMSSSDGAAFSADFT